MNTTAESRTNFGRRLKSLRNQRYLTLRALHELSGVVYTIISAVEQGERAIGPDVATRLADGLGLCGHEREEFLVDAAATRRKDRLVSLARTLPSELVNFVPMALHRQGMDLGALEACEVRQTLDGESPQALSKLRTALAKASKSTADSLQGDFLVLSTGGREYLCALMITPTN